MFRITTLLVGKRVKYCKTQPRLRKLTDSNNKINIKLNNYIVLNNN